MAGTVGGVLLLIVFGFVAGAATALSPCVLPVLGVVTGLVLSCTFATIALVYVISALGLPDDLLRSLAIVVLVGFGLALIVPRLAAWVEVGVSRIIPQRQARARSDGFGSGVLLGASLGLVYAPCAGPILAGVITASRVAASTAGRLGRRFLRAGHRGGR